jgi:putative transcriptional regulator
MESLKGNFLISRYNLPDPNFRETVVFLIEHNEEGAFGFIINRLLDLHIAEVLPQLQGDRAQNSRLYLGGPVQKEYIMALHDGMGIESGVEVVPGVYFEPVFENLFPYFQDQDVPARILTFAGYSGWGSGQLENEMENDTWMTLPGDQDLVFVDDPDKGWRKALRAKGGLYQVFADTTQDPELN